MELATLIAPEEAKAHLAEYEAQLLDERTAEDDAIRAGYRAAARGLPVISLSAAIASGGWFDDGLPRLAIVRADATEVWCWRSSTEVVYGTEEWPRSRSALVGRHTVRVPLPEGLRGWASGKTVVPTIPPRLRPRPARLARRHILWEVERWDPTPPTDPALVRHIRGDLWAVEAVWDLTPLERAVLSQRAR